MGAGPGQGRRRENTMGHIRNATWVLARRRAASGAPECGQGLAEYALILALIAIVAIVALLFLGGAISGILSDVGGSI
jgi:pilus assembly protein Flp/PilA